MILLLSLCRSATLAAICTPLALNHGPRPIRSFALTGVETCVDRSQLSNQTTWSAPARVRLRDARALHSIKLDRFLEVLGCSESDFLARFDLDRLYGRGVSSHASEAFANLQKANAGEPYAIALLQVLRHQVDGVVQ